MVSLSTAEASRGLRIFIAAAKYRLRCDYVSIMHFIHIESGASHLTHSPLHDSWSTLEQVEISILLHFTARGRDYLNRWFQKACTMFLKSAFLSWAVLYFGFLSSLSWFISGRSDAVSRWRRCMW